MPPTPDPQHPRPPQVSSEQLLGPGGVMIIRHGSADYELRVTKRKRLILTKRHDDAGSTGTEPADESQ
jgi:hemin uptake protein HemP